MKLAFTLCLWSATATSTLANPMRRVITLLQDMQKEVEAEGEKEKKLYDNFMCFCKNSNKELSAGGSGAKGQIEKLSAQLEEEQAEKSQISQELIQHKKDRADAQNDLAKAKSIREREHEEYVAQTGEQNKNIQDIKAAITALEKGMGATAFAQLPAVSVIKRMVSGIDVTDAQNVMSFLSQSGDYVPQGGQIVGIMKNMLDDMDKNLNGAVSEEERAAAAYADLKDSKEKEIAAASEAIEDKTKRSGELAVSVVQTQNALDDAGAELGDTQKFLANLSVQCDEKTKEWQERSETRHQEITAIGEAISVLNDDDALDVFKSTIPSPSLASVSERRYRFLQAKQESASPLAKARTLVNSASEMYRSSKALNLLSFSLSSKLKSLEKQGGVDFAVVTKMIDDMVTLLGKEQADDTKHKNWCEAEFDKSSDDGKAAQEKIDSLASCEQEISDEIASTKDSIATLQQEIQELDQSVATATAQRKQEHSEYTETMTMTEAAIQLIEKAKNRLNKFYNPNLYKAPAKRELTQEEKLYADAGRGEWNATPAPQGIAGTTQTVFIQLHKFMVAPPAAPETFGAYQKKDGKSKGVIALMDMLQKDLEKDMTEAEHNEKTAQKDYAELTSDAQATRAQDSKSITDKESNKAKLEGKLQEVKSQSVMTADELNQVRNYVAELHSSCDFITQNFDLRKQARTNEVESLKNAKAVLSGANYS